MLNSKWANSLTYGFPNFSLLCAAVFTAAAAHTVPSGKVFSAVACTPDGQTDGGKASEDRPGAASPMPRRPQETITPASSHHTGQETTYKTRERDKKEGRRKRYCCYCCSFGSSIVSMLKVISKAAVIITIYIIIIDITNIMMGIMIRMIMISITIS